MTDSGTDPRTDPIVISGCGMVSPAGVGVDAFVDLMLANRQILAPIPDLWHRYADFHSQRWAPLPALNWKQYGIPRATELQCDPVTLLGFLAAEEALRSAGLVEHKTAAHFSLKQRKSLGEYAADRCAVSIGCGIGGYQSIIANDEVHRFDRINSSDLAALERICEGRAQSHIQAIKEVLRCQRRFNPFTVAMTMPNATAAHIAQHYTCEGPCRAPSLACASGTVAIGQAFDWLERGDVDCVIAGGVEMAIDRHGGSFRAFDVTGALIRPDADGQYRNRPFDELSTGFTMAEGAAGVVVLERASAVRRRGLKPLARICSWAENTSAQSGIMATDQDGVVLERCHNLVLKKAGWAAEDVELINAHGTGTDLNDQVEAKIIRSLYRPNCLVQSTKALIGHSLGASGAVETIATVLALSRNLVHGNPGLRHPRLQLHAPQQTQQRAVKRAVNVSAAFGGHNAILALEADSND